LLIWKIWNNSSANDQPLGSRKFYVTDHHHLTYALGKTAKGENQAGIDTK
jgi:hypothetical protein